MKRTLSILLFLLLLLTATALASSVGIIGGADGPTAIFVSGNSFFSRMLSAVLRFFFALFGR